MRGKRVILGYIVLWSNRGLGALDFRICLRSSGKGFGFRLGAGALGLGLKIWGQRPLSLGRKGLIQWLPSIPFRDQKLS